MSENNQPRLVNQAILTKIDKLRELNVRNVNLPQIISVGDQSSGKSSVLESLTGFSFPQGTGLCTRYATQISCRREPAKKVTVSIAPGKHRASIVAERLRAFSASPPEVTPKALLEIISKANTAMGIKNTPEDSGSAFSDDMLVIEICGPDQEHFTVIDVPGIFRVPQRGFTEDSDVVLVKNMVKRYMANPRTIILAVLPSNVDISTQEILKMAESVDPKGERTMGVLTKPDLVYETATLDAVKELVMGQRNKLLLGYCVVKNRGADDHGSTLSHRLVKEREFFENPDWVSLAFTNRCGIGSLKSRLSGLLMKITTKEFPNVKTEVARCLDESRRQLESMGPSRKEESAQRIYLGRLAARFQTLTTCALNGSYDIDAVLEDNPALKLATTVTKMNERFADDFWKHGHKRQFLSDSKDTDEQGYNVADDEVDDSDSDSDAITVYPELRDIIEMARYECPEPIASDQDSIEDHIWNVYEMNRGPELGTVKLTHLPKPDNQFSGTILAIAFKEQSEKWDALVLEHVRKSIILVHGYALNILAHICPDKQVRDQLWETLVIEELRKTYARAMDQARFLLRIERYERPSSYNHYFNSEIQKKRQDRFIAACTAKKTNYYTGTIGSLKVIEGISTANLENLAVNQDNTEQVRDDILDVLTSYYKVSRKRFVDTVCRQVIGHFLLEGEESPLRIFTPELIMGLDSDQLEKIAGEDTQSKDRRAMLEAEIKNLEAAMKVLRS
ncbi:interferon-induced GTP-binding protein Mx2 [Massariosphaeria phaeospora]|uniref:Interferon-induced GTP-binding protein Mx2 n=1 Tax=Massariosphaeria phaeospora TaxID=100035 RepID=A0A7C8I7R6_9PLEO|nr:interferon-induced GTP-binding protein Mx2 [Massariosphaeria phaeospora]